MLMRSKLFVPAGRPELFPKALAGDADALSFDLEDAVLDSRKDEARANLRDFLRSEALWASEKTIIVRINPVGSPHCAVDLDAVLEGRADWINVPKVENVEGVRYVAEILEQLERAHPPRRGTRLLLTIESPRGLREAQALASAHPRVVGLQLGFGDLFSPLGIARDNVAAIEATLFALRMAAGEAGGVLCDSAFTDLCDPDGFLREARRARAFGCIGKSCIHPSQVALANAVFAPDAGEIAAAAEVVKAVAGASADGHGAFVVAGRMIDAPYLRRAEAVLAQARRLGLLAREGEETA